MSYVRDQVNRNGPLEEKSSFITYNVTCDANTRTIIGRKKVSSQDRRVNGNTFNNVHVPFLISLQRKMSQNARASVLNSRKYGQDISPLLNWSRACSR